MQLKRGNQQRKSLKRPIKLISLQPKKKREKIQITNIRNERGDIIKDLTAIKRIIMKYYKQLYAHKFDNLDEMDQFFERHNLPKEQIESEQAYICIYIRLIYIIGLYMYIYKINTESTRFMGLMVNSYQTFRDKIIQILYNLFQNTTAERIRPNSFFQASITLIPKSYKDITRKPQTNISHEHKCKNP